MAKSFNSIKAGWSNPNKEVGKKKSFKDIKSADYDFGVGEDYIKSFLDRSKEYFDNVESETSSVNFKNAKSKYSSNQDKIQTLVNEARTLRAYYNVNKGKLDPETYNSMMEYLDGFERDSSSVLANYRNKADMYSKFESEDQYNDAVKIGELNELPSAEIEKQMGFSRDTYETELAPLKEEYNKLNKDIQFYGRGDKSRFASAKDYNDAKIRRDKLKKQMTDLKGKNGIAYTTSGGQNITWKSLYDEAKGKEDFKGFQESIKNEDFEEKSQTGLSRNNPSPNLVENLEKIDGKWYITGAFGKKKEIKNILTFVRDNADSLGNVKVNEDFQKMLKANDDEVSLYSYLLETDEKQAQRYLDLLMPSLLDKRSDDLKERLDVPVLKHIASVGQGMANYVDSVGIKDYSNDATMIAMEKLQSEAKGLDKYLMGAGTTIGNMLPSIMISYLTSGIASGLGASEKVVSWAGRLSNASSVGLSAGGSAYQQKIAEGWNPDDAQSYATLIGISEASLETVLSGIVGTTGFGAEDLIKKADMIENGLLRFLSKSGIRLASEEIEEIAQLYLEPTFEVIIKGGDYDQPTIDELIETAIVTAISTGVLNSPASISEAVNDFKKTKLGKAIKDAGQARNLVDLGKSLGEGTESYEAANKIGDKSRALAIGNLLGIVADGIPNANKADMIKAFEEKGYNTREATLLVNKMTEQGLDSVANIRGMLSPTQTYNDVLNDPNSTISQRNEAYRGILQGVAENKLQRAMSQAVKNKSAIAPHKDSTDEQGKLPTQEEEPIESKFESNTEGKDFNSKNDKIIASKKLVSSEKDNMKFEVTYDDGTTDTVDANDIDFGNEGEALVYSYVMDMNVPVGIAEPLISGYKGNDVNSAGTYINGMREAFVFGKHNQEADLHSGAYVSQLTEEQRNNAFKIGSLYAKEKAIADEKAIRGETKPTDIKKQEGKVHFEGDKLSLKSVQDVSLESLGVLSKALGKDFHLYESYKDANGKRVYKDANGNIKKAPNGFYRQLDGSIWIDLNAGNSGEGTMMFTVAHELTHFIKQWSPTKFKALADFLVEQYGKEGVSVHELVLAQQEKAKKNGREISYDVAFEEMVADSMETMLTDGKVIRELANKDKGLFDKIKSWIDNLLRKLNKEYKNYSPESNEGQMLREMKKTFEEAQRLFAEALTDASDNFAIRGTDKAFVENYLKTKDVVYNLRAVESHQDKLAENYTTDASIDLETLQKRYAKIIGIWEKLGGELNSKFLNEWNNKVGKDRAFTIFKAQAGYKYNVELSSMCKKGVPLFEAIDTIVKKEIMNELKTKTLGKAEKEILYDILKNHNFEIPCAICYVEQARQREGVIINDFLDGKIEKNSKGKITKYKLGWNDVLNKVEKEMKKNGVEYTFRNVDKSIATDSYAPADIVMDEATQDAFYKALKKVANAEIVRWNREERKSNQKERRQITDLKPQTIKEVFKGTLPSNLKIFKVLFNNPSSRFKISRDLLYSSATTLNLANAHNDLYSLFNSQGGVAGYKTKQAPIVYWGDILGKSWRPSTVRKEGGIRNQSNSDFQMYTLLDQAQMYIDFSAKGYYLQAYTKVLAELKLFGLSRGKINASLIPQVIEHKNADGSINWEKTMENAGLDENGNPIYDDFEGINHTEAFMLIEDAEYSKNICGICIGYSDNHIRKLLDDNRVQQIIGFHDKTDNPEKRYRGAKYSKNYNGLNEAVKIKADGTEETVHVGFNQFVSKAEKMFKFNKKTETFEGTVNHNGKEYSANDIPRLAADLYLEMCAEKNYRPAYNDFSSHKNYYKLLADFGLYDSQGNYAPHQKVQYNMPDKVPYLDKNGNKAYMPTEAYIKAELQKELKVRDSISEALADTSENGIIPQFVERVNALHSEKAATILNSDRDSTYMEAVNSGDMETAQRLVEEYARVSGYTEKVLHGTNRFGFTKIKTSGVEELVAWSPFFATDSVETAGTYSGSQNIKRIADSSMQTDEDREEILKSMQSESIGFAEFCNSELGIRGWVDYDYFSNKINECVELLENGTKLSKVQEDFEGFCDEMFYTFIDNYYYENYNEKEFTFEAFEESKEYEDLSDKFYDYVYKIVGQFNSFDYESTTGIYDLYANTEGLLEFDAQGTRWNRLPDPREVNGESGISEEFGFKMFNTRDYAEYAKENGYKGVKITNIFDDGGKSVQGQTKPATVYIFFNPQTQIKSADPVTYDDNGNVIPLSERFNTANEDIRYQDRDSEGNKLSKEQIEFFKYSKIRDKKGRLLPVYHGTKNAGFTMFTKSDEIGYFFARHLKTAQTYSGGSKAIYAPNKNSEQISGAANYKTYLNIKKPYIIDGNGANWNGLESTGEKVQISIKTSKWSEGKGLGKITFKYGGKTYNQIIHNATDFEQFITKHLNKDMASAFAFAMNSTVDKNGKGEFNAGFAWDFNNKTQAETKNTRDIVRRAYNSRWDYDGVVFKNVVDSGDGTKIKADDLYVAFDSNQIKSVANTEPTSNPDIRYSERDYSYDSLVSKPDMAITSVNDKVTYKPTSTIRKNIVEKAIKNASSFGKLNENGNVVIRVDDIDTDVILSKNSLAHGLDRRLEISAPVILNVGSILKNSIRINELTPKKQSAIGSYVLIGYAESTDYAYPVRMVVNQYTNEVDTIDVLYAVNTKKETVGKMPGSHGKTALPTVSNIRIADLLEFVNKHFSDVLPESVLKHYGHTERPKGELGESALFSDRDNSSVSTRTLLANALEGAAQNDIEKNKLAQYKEKIALIEAEQNKLHELREKLFTKGIKGAERREIQEEATRTANRINTYDRQLFNLESTTALKNVLNREKELARKRQKQKDNENLRAYKEKVAETTRELLERNRESRQKAIEGRTKTEMRHKVKKVVNDLNNLLLKPTKERHIPEAMRMAVAEALDIVNMDTVDADTRVARYNELIAKANNLDVIASLTETRDRILEQGNKLGEKLDKLKSAYVEIKASGDDSVNSMYDDVIYSKIEKVQKDVGKTPLRNMTLGQLESVYELYEMVLTTVRDSNKAFAENLKMTRQALGSNTFAEIKDNNKARDKIKHEFIERFGWQNLKPMQAMKTIGSSILQKLWNNILYGQEIFAQDYDEAVKFAKEMKEKYGYKKWDLNKLYSFESKSGKVMKINLEQMMSIYAYSKRKQADEHIEFGGIVLNEGVIKEKNKLGKIVEVKVNDSTAYRLDKFQVGEIIDTLEKKYPGAKDFVDEMQKYLSETMGEKGNEVSMKMYGIKLFKEEHYFPLKSSKDFMESANAKLKGDVKIKNKGMTKSTVEHARNPIVLENFLDVWGNHINEMAMYHGLVLPLEDFSRTLNYGFKADETINADAESVKTALHEAFGNSAEDYLNELLKAINGGVLHDSTSSIADKMISKFKKAKVMASLSVIVQQPTAIIRAMGIIEPKYFVAQNLHHKATWEELKKYCPTAIIKETGSFDTNMGRTIVDMIKEDRTFTDKVGDTLGKAPAYMDEMGWNMIWRALKNKVATEQNLSGEALLQECGKQMTLIVNETQVYDSVMSRNELMRSKSAFTKMATSFMGEPTTVANMVYGAVLDFKRGNKKVASKTVAAVISSVVINGLVSSLVYAFRDDDEEKTFLEKYVSSATTEVLEGFNPLTYIPFVKDGYSLFQGYDVERTDMALIGDVVDAIDDFYNVLDPEAYEGMSRGEIAKHIYENAKPLLTSICDMFGLPVGNILRDAEAIIVNDNLPMSKTSSEGIGLAAKEGWLNSSLKIVQKFVDDEKYHKLYLIANNGDTAYVKSEVAEMVAEKLDTYKEEEDTLVKAEKKAKQTVKSSFTGVYRDVYKKAYKKKDLEEMNRIRKFLYATNLWKSLSELDKLLSKWREDA